MEVRIINCLDISPESETYANLVQQTTMGGLPNSTVVQRDDGGVSWKDYLRVFEVKGTPNEIIRTYVLNSLAVSSLAVKKDITANEFLDKLDSLQNWLEENFKD